jgi:hypothetical protein
LSLHGGVFQSCGPPIDPNSTKEEECFKFEEILGPYTPLQLLQIRGFLAFTLLSKINPHAQNDLKNVHLGLLEAVTHGKSDIFENAIIGYGTIFYPRFLFWGKIN